MGGLLAEALLFSRMVGGGGQVFVCTLSRPPLRGTESLISFVELDSPSSLCKEPEVELNWTLSGVEGLCAFPSVL